MFRPVVKGKGVRGEALGVDEGLEWSLIMFWKINSHYCATLREALGEGVCVSAGGRGCREGWKANKGMDGREEDRQKGRKLLWSVF